MYQTIAGPIPRSVVQRTFQFGSALSGLLLVLTGCQGAPVRSTGYLSTYDNVNVAKISPFGTTSVPKRVEEAEKVGRVYIQPAIFRLEGDLQFSKDDLDSVRNEVDRQLCFEISKYFIVDFVPSDQAATARTAIVILSPTGRAGSVASAAAHFVVPIVDLRSPMSTGGIGIETEMVGPDGKQVTSLLWSRQAEVVGRVKPSLSRVGDALQLAKPMASAVGKTFKPYGHSKLVPEPDPCARYGSRLNAKGKVAGALMGAGTGLYAPEASGAGAKATQKK
jgi:hypothetical protein